MTEHAHVENLDKPGRCVGCGKDMRATEVGAKPTELCGKFVSWWNGEYEGTCELPEGHAGPHYDGISCFDNEGDEVELKSPPLPPVVASVGYYKSGKPYQVQKLVLNNDNQIICLQPEAGVEIRVELTHG